MNIAIKPVPASMIRALAERYPDLDRSELAKKGGWTYGQVQSALKAQTAASRKFRAS